MLSLKPGVRLLGLRPETLLAIVVAGRVFNSHGADLVITSGAAELADLEREGMDLAVVGFSDEELRTLLTERCTRSRKLVQDRDSETDMA